MFRCHHSQKALKPPLSTIKWLNIFSHLRKHRAERGNNKSIVQTQRSYPGRLEWIFGERRAPNGSNKGWTSQLLLPGLEITETRHPGPPVGLFVRLREGQSTAADRCVCSRFRTGSCGEVRHRFLCPVPLEGRQGSSQDVWG